MPAKLTSLVAVVAACAAAAIIYPSRIAARQKPPRTILFDVSPRAVEYQLRRLDARELVLLERDPGDARYRPVYLALLTRTGVGREYFDEALAALTKMDTKSPARVLLDGLEAVPPDDAAAAARLLRVLLGQPAERLRQDRDGFDAAVRANRPKPVLRGAYGAIMLADGSPNAAWQAAASQPDHLIELLRSVPYLGPAPEVREQLAVSISGMLEGTTGPMRAAALTALAAARPDTATFRVLSQEVLQSGDAELRIAAIRALHAMPEASWPPGELEPLARAVVAQVKGTPPDARTGADTLEAMQFGERLAARLSDEARRAVLRDIRAAGVQVVQIDTVPEQMAFSLKWFVVEAARRVQIVLNNPDAMPHNLLIGKPGSLQEIGTAASTMPMPTDPTVKAYVPDSPLVLQATRLLNWGESERLTFTAPKEPGDYIFVCTFPGHWVRMYGVMLVVNDLEAWEAKRTVPTDPMTGKPFPSQGHQ